ncbi:hypothetical protein ACIGXI_12355 [Kitasatospora aureofaciens]|uniref:hypothetical protein n=1 Tax=Kitasatospora aureofaciens TaxID=1894 RepID=UPI0037C7DED8
MTTPPPSQPPSPAPHGPGYGFPQQAPGAAGFGPPPGLPASPGAGVPLAGTGPGGPCPAGPGPAGPGPGPVPAGGAPGGRSGGNLRRNAVWAFVGALLASAGWTTAVLVVPGMVGSSSGDSAPRSLGSYHVSDDFCAVGKPNRLLEKYSVNTTGSSPSHHTDRNPALDSMNCSMSLKRTGGTSDSEYASVYLRADLHKAVNPAPELSANKETYRTRGYQISNIPGIGEDAYFVYKDDGSSDKYRDVYAEVDVRDGGMTFYITYSASYTQGKATPPSMDELRTMLQSDADSAVRAMRK